MNDMVVRPPILRSAAKGHSFRGRHGPAQLAIFQTRHPTQTYISPSLRTKSAVQPEPILPDSNFVFCGAVGRGLLEMFLVNVLARLSFQFQWYCRHLSAGCSLLPDCLALPLLPRIDRPTEKQQQKRNG